MKTPALVQITPLFAVTGALAEEDFAALAAAGYRMVISNRPDGEEQGQPSGRQEAAMAWRAGLRFRHVPASKLDLFTDDVVEAMQDAISAADGPIVAHCKSGLRSAIAWAAASARSQPVDCVLAALANAGFELGFLRDDLEAQADRRRWLERSAALDCATSQSVVREIAAA